MRPMAGPTKSKATPAVKSDTLLVKSKPAQGRPPKTLTLEEASETLSTLDFSNLTEEDRLSSILEIRARLVEQAHTIEPPAQALARRILLLRLWHELVQLRISDVQKDLDPPYEILKTERLFPPVAAGGEGADLTVAPDDHSQALNEALKPLDAKPYAPPSTAGEEHLVSVKLLEAEMVRGMKLPAGITVDVQPEDADHLIERGKAVRV